MYAPAPCSYEAAARLCRSAGGNSKRDQGPWPEGHGEATPSAACCSNVASTIPQCPATCEPSSCLLNHRLPMALTPCSAPPPEGVTNELWSLRGLEGKEPAQWTPLQLEGPAPASRRGHAVAGGSPGAWPRGPEHSGMQRGAHPGEWPGWPAGRWSPGGQSRPGIEHLRLLPAGPALPMHPPRPPSHPTPPLPQSRAIGWCLWAASPSSAP